jgi:hypothetical protein
VTRARAAAAAIAAAGLVLAGCSGSDDQAEPSPSTTAAPTTTTTVPEADLRVLDPGAEPRRELRYRLTEGSATLATFTTDLELEQERAGVRQRLDAPPVRQTLAHRVTSVDDDGVAQVESEVVALEVQADGTGLTVAEVDELQRQLAPLARTTGSVEVGLRGEVLGVEAGDGSATDDGTDDATDDLAAAALGLAPVLPEEPVGIGGRWEIATDVELGGRPAVVERTYTLTALDDEGFTWELDVTIDGASTFTGQASGSNRWDAPVGELTARIEGDRWLDPETLEPTTPPPDPSASSTTGPIDEPDAVLQEVVLAYRATAADPTAPTPDPTTTTTAPPSGTTPAGDTDGT